jgi:hypothetical protein
LTFEEIVVMKCASAFVVLGLLVASFAVFGDDAASPEPTAPTAEQIDQWVSELGDTRFATRRNATDSLVAAGEPAIEPVVNAALEGSAEVAVRCVQILRRLKESADPAVSEAANTGLRTLADSDNPLVNERALAALDETPLDPNPVAQFGQPGAIQIQIQGGVFAAGRTTRTEVNNNGERTITVDDNGKKIEISDHDGEDIEIKITETVNGQEETSEYSAENVEDLKTNHPEIAKLYEQHTQPNAQFQVFAAQMQQIPNLQRRAFPVPVAPNLPGFAPAEDDVNQQTAEDLASAIERLESISATLEDLKESEDADEAALEELVQELNAVVDELAAAKDQLDD